MMIQNGVYPLGTAITATTAAVALNQLNLNGATFYVDDNGSGYDGTTALQVSPDGTTWFTALDLAAAAVSFAGPGIRGLVGGARSIRVSITGRTVGNIDVWIVFPPSQNAP